MNADAVQDKRRREVAARLVAAYGSGVPAPLPDVLVESLVDAYVIQDLVLRETGPADGWKVGARGITATPLCSPLPHAVVRNAVDAKPWAFTESVPIELEIALRFVRDVDPARDDISAENVLSLFDVALPAIEVIQRRVAMGKDVHALTYLADNLGHGVLVLGTPGCPAREVDLIAQEARLLVDGVEVKRTIGGNPSVDVRRILVWMAEQCAARGHRFTRGQIVTTGSCTGMFDITATRTVTGVLPGIGTVEMQFQRQ